MGQGIAVTRLQMTMAMCAIANKGVLMAPMLVERLEDRDHNVIAQYAPQRVRQVLSERSTRQIIEALKTVRDPRGHRAKSGPGALYSCGEDGDRAKIREWPIGSWQVFRVVYRLLPGG